MAEVPDLLRPGMTVYVAGCAGEPTGVLDAIRARPETAADVTFTGVWIPGVNRFDWTALTPSTRARCFFVTPELRSGFARRQVDFLPLHYTRIFPYLGREAGIDLAIFTVSPPDADGMVSLGVANDFTPSVLDGPAKTVAVVNPAMPATHGAVRYPLDRFDLVTEDASPLVTMETGEVPPDIAAVGHVIAGLVNDGDTLQLGLGKVQAAVLQALEGRRDLRIHAGMISDPVLPLLDDGTLTGIVTNVALGTAPLYGRCGADPRIRFRPTGYTHDFGTLRAIPNLIAVNSVIEIDLFGQANAEMLDGRQISGHGGLVDFLRGGPSAPGGRSVLATAAAAKGGTVSRIVPRLHPDTVSTTLRADADLVVTEHGVADLRHKSVDQRAEALIAIAAPGFRDGLAEAWRGMRAAM